MLLRPRQTAFVDRMAEALAARRNTLGVAPTGAGKTVMLSALIVKTGQRALVLQHRDELVAQNRRTLHRFDKRIASGKVDAAEKTTGRDVTYAMVPTLARNLDLIRNDIKLVVVDEAHHTAAKSYCDILQRVRDMNPDAAIAGVTATPNRGDKKGLRGWFDNVADQITLLELIQAGHLVPPRTFVIDIGVQSELRSVKRNLQDFDMAAVEAIMDKTVLNEHIVDAWKEKADDRQTVVFCSTVAHAEHVRDAFAAAGVSTGIVTGDMAGGERKAVLAAFDRAEFQVLVNVMVLTEGWDCQPVSCIVLLRPSSFKSTLIQMIGRGLRKLDPEQYPGRPPKLDCIVLDFGTSILTHGALEQEPDLEGREPGAALTKICPDCASEIPQACQECPICGHVFESAARDVAAAPKGVLDGFVMTEVDLFKSSPYRWEDLFKDESVLMAASFEAWAVALYYGGNWHAIGGVKEVGVKKLYVGDRLMALSTADDFLRAHGDADSAGKAKRWLYEPATDKQISYLPWAQALPPAERPTKYQAACHMTFVFNQRGIQAKLADGAPTARAA